LSKIQAMEVSELIKLIVNLSFVGLLVSSVFWVIYMIHYFHIVALVIGSLSSFTVSLSSASICPPSQVTQLWSG